MFYRISHDKLLIPWVNADRLQGMEELIKQAFLHVDVIGPHVQEGHYDLIGPNGEIILPSIWEKIVQPDWAITMHMWPMDKTPPLRGAAGLHQHHGLPFRPGAAHGHPHPAGMRMPNGLPPGMRPAGMRPGGGGGPGGGGIPVPPPGFPGRQFPPGVGPGLPPGARVINAEPRVKKTTKSSNSVLGWMAGGSKTKSGKKYVWSGAFVTEVHSKDGPPRP